MSCSHQNGPVPQVAVVRDLDFSTPIQRCRSSTTAACGTRGGWLPVLLLSVLMLSGCAGDTAVAHGHNTALDGTDLVTMTDDMSMKLVADPKVQAAIDQEGKLRVVVEPVENNMTGEVLPAGPSRAFTGRLRVLLAKHAPDKFTWVMNLQAWHYLQRKELDIDPGPSPEAVQPKYALTAEFSTLTKEDSSRRSIYYLCVFKLTDLRDRRTIWTDKYEVRKNAVKGFLD